MSLGTHSVLQPSAKPSLIRRVTSKLHISIPLKSSDALCSRPFIRTSAADIKGSRPPRVPALPTPVSPTLPNGLGSKEHREAALRERGLLPPRKDFSQQEREADDRIGYAVSPVSSTSMESTEAEKLKASWLAMNKTSEGYSSGGGSRLSPYFQGTETGPQSSSDCSETNVSRRSGDLPCTARPSFCSSLPPLSTCCLEVLHEDPSEQGPITPPPCLSPLRSPIIVSSPLDYPSSPILLESPVSCKSSSHCPGSTLESQSQSDHFSFRKKETKHSHAPRRHASDACERPLKAVGRTLSRLGSRSLSNIRRRSVMSLGQASTSTFSSSNFSIPRTAVSPTMHSMASIIRETGVIEDAESRRLSEVAFLD